MAGAPSEQVQPSIDRLPVEQRETLLPKLRAIRYELHAICADHAVLSVNRW